MRKKVIRASGISLLTILLASTLTSSLSFATTNFATAESTGAVIKISPESGPPGSVVLIEGWGLPHNTVTDVYFDEEFLGGATTSDTGTLDKVVTIPITATVGTHSIRSSDGVNTVEIPFTITPTPSITLSSENIVTESEITIAGSNFAPSRSIEVRLDGSLLETVPSSISSSTKGNFSAVVIIPYVQSGRHIISATDGIFTGSKTIEIKESSRIMLSSNSGPAGSIVTISGSGFSPSAYVTIRFDSTRLATTPANILSSSQGTFSASITIPTGIASGTNTISAVDEVGKIGSTGFTVTSSGLVTTSPASSYSGSSVTVSGSGFNPNSIIIVKLDTMRVATQPSSIRTDESGSFVGEMIIPFTESTGPHMINVMDGVGRTGSSIVNIVPAPPLSVSNDFGIAGYEISVSGTGYAPNSQIELKFDSLTLSDIRITTDHRGNFKTMLRIPEDASEDMHKISAIDELGRSSSAFLTVVDPALISLSPSSGPPGTEVVVTGSKFINGTQLDLLFDGNAVTTLPPEIVASALGNFVAKFRIPVNATQGTYTIMAQDRFGIIGAAEFIVLNEGTFINVSQTTARSGTSIEVSGSGFPPFSAVTVQFDGQNVLTHTPRINTTRAGTFVATFNAPGNAANGEHLITVISGNVTSTAALDLKRQFIDDRYGILISVIPEKYDFQVGETLAISGSVLALNNGFPLIFKIINPNNAACSFQQLSLDENMEFTASPVTLHGPLCSVPGEYKITAFYGKGKSLTKFKVSEEINNDDSDELTGGKVEVINAQLIPEFLRYDNKYPVDLDWTSNAVLLRNNVNQTFSFYLMFAEYDADEITRKLSYQEVTLSPFERSFVVAPYVPKIIDGRPDGYLHVFAWTSLNEPKRLHPGLYIPY